jgi:prepilin-type N-terminal cleavage/methylation domain-containing protein
MSSRGFTIFELLIVVSIVGLLASAFVVATGRSRAQSRDHKRKSDLLTIQTALESFFNQYKYYPTNCAAGYTGAAPDWGGVNSQSKPWPGAPADSGIDNVNKASGAWPNRRSWIYANPRSTTAPFPCPTSTLNTQFAQHLTVVPQDPINSGQYVYRYRTNSTNEIANSPNSAIRYELDAAFEVDSIAMQNTNDNGNCETRYELFNVSGNLLGC